MSEAQQYQLIRKYWKDRYRTAQRKQSIATWERDNKEPHPSIVKFLKERGFHGNPAVNSPKHSSDIAFNFQMDASNFADLLNRFKVKNDY